MFGLKGNAKMLRESFAAGATNTGNVTATVGNKLVLNWHGTPTRRSMRSGWRGSDAGVMRGFWISTSRASSIKSIPSC
jgi:hypothetical protein